MSRDLDRLIAVCDPGIRRAVRVLREAGIATFQSCQGGEGHAASEPLVQFGAGRPEEGWSALSVCLSHGLPVLYLRLQWNIEHGHHPTGPYWEIVFRDQLAC